MWIEGKKIKENHSKWPIIQLAFVLLSVLKCSVTITVSYCSIADLF